MRLDEFKFKVTDKESGASAVLSFNDLFGYEGEECGIFIRHDLDHIPDELKDKAINYNSGYGHNGINEDIDIKITQ